MHRDTELHHDSHDSYRHIQNLLKTEMHYETACIYFLLATLLIAC